MAAEQTQEWGEGAATTELGDWGEEREGQACSTELRVSALEKPGQAVPIPAPQSSCVARLGPGDIAEEEAQPLSSWRTLSPSQVPGRCRAWPIINSSWTSYLRPGPANRGPRMRHLTNKVWEGRRGWPGGGSGVGR